MKTVKDILTSNITWIITAILTAGAIGATLKYQEDAIAGIIAKQNDSISRDSGLELSIAKLDVKMESLKENMCEMKSDIKDIKLIILKPIGSSYHITNTPTNNPPNVMLTHKTN